MSPVNTKTDQQAKRETASQQSSAHTANLAATAESRVFANTSLILAAGDIATDVFHGHWHDFIPAAKQYWNRFSDHKLARIAGRESRLTELVQ
jgi:hypothetical protein